MIAGWFNKEQRADLKLLSHHDILTAIGNTLGSPKIGQINRTVDQDYLVFTSKNDKHQIGVAIINDALKVIYKLKPDQNKSDADLFVVRETHQLPDTQIKLDKFIKKQSGIWKRFFAYRKPPIEGLKKLTV